MDLIILNDGMYSLVPVTKAMLADLALFSNVNPIPAAAHPE